MTLDPRTIAYATAAVAALLFGLMLMYWRTCRTYSGFGLWVASLGLIALVLSGITWRELFPAVVSEAGVNLGSIAAMAAIVIGAHRFFDDRRPHLWLWALIATGVVTKSDVILRIVNIMAINKKIADIIR